MKSSASFQTRLILAVLPLAGETFAWDHTWRLGGVVCLAFLGTVLFFKITQTLFPKPLLKLALLLWIACLAQAGWLLWKLSPLGSVSLALLSFSQMVPGPIFSPTASPLGGPIFECSLKDALKQGFGFWGFTVLLGMSGVLFNRFLEAPNLFLLPAGAFLILAITAAIQPWWKVRARHG